MNNLLAWIALAGLACAFPSGNKVLDVGCWIVFGILLLVTIVVALLPASGR